MRNENWGAGKRSGRNPCVCRRVSLVVGATVGGRPPFKAFKGPYPSASGVGGSLIYRRTLIRVGVYRSLILDRGLKTVRGKNESPLHTVFSFRRVP